MKPALDTAMTWLGSIIATVGVGASARLDELSGGIPDHSTIWFLLAVVAILVVVLVCLYIQSWRRVESALAYRTNYALIESQTRALEASVPHPHPHRTHAMQPTGLPQAVPKGVLVSSPPCKNLFERMAEPADITWTSQPQQCGLIQVRSRAIAAALRDMARGTNTRNLYAAGTEACKAWDEAYTRAYTPCAHSSHVVHQSA